MITRGTTGDFFALRSDLEVRARVPNIKTVDIPAPTAASVKATSTASSVINSKADKRLKTPESVTTANRLLVRTTPRAVITSIVNRHISVKFEILGLPFRCHYAPFYLSLFNLAEFGRFSDDLGLSPDISAAFATACVDVGPVINKNIPIINNLTVTNVRPA